MSALPPKADIETQSRDVRFVPEPDSRTVAKSIVFHGVIPVAGYPFSPMSDLPHQWVGNSATGKSAAERSGRSRGW
jgi:hypothetical protein